jgi:hypothetical protein
MTNETTAVLAALRAAKEAIDTDANGIVWGMVYLDNAHIKGMSRHQFAGHLSALKAQGLYIPTYDPAFGEVKMEG